MLFPSPLYRFIIQYFNVLFRDTSASIYSTDQRFKWKHWQLSTFHCTVTVVSNKNNRSAFKKKTCRDTNVLKWLLKQKKVHLKLIVSFVGPTLLYNYLLRLWFLRIVFTVNIRDAPWCGFIYYQFCPPDLKCTHMSVSAVLWKIINSVFKIETN